MKQLQTLQYQANQKAKQQTAMRSQQTPRDETIGHLLTATTQSDVDDDKSTASSTQYFNISENRLPVTTIGDETLPTIDLRRTEHEDRKRRKKKKRN